MPYAYAGEFDRLQQQLEAGEAVIRLPPDTRRWLDDQIAQMTPPVSAPVHGLAKATNARDYDDGDAFFQVACHPRVPSAAEQQKASAELRKAVQAAGAGVAQVAAIHRSITRERARDTARAVLAKALEAVHAGQMTAHEAAQIESLAHRVMAQASAS